MIRAQPCRFSRRDLVSAGTWTVACMHKGQRNACGMSPGCVKLSSAIESRDNSPATVLSPTCQAELEKHKRTPADTTRLMPSSPVSVGCRCSWPASRFRRGVATSDVTEQSSCPLLATLHGCSRRGPLQHQHVAAHAHRVCHDARCSALSNLAAQDRQCISAEAQRGPR